MGRALVTGGAGFIGSHMVDALMARGAVRVVDNLSSGQRASVSQWEGRTGFELIKADLLDEAALDGHLEGVDLIVHLAANPEVRLAIHDQRVDLQQGIVATSNVLRAAQRAGVPKVLFASSSTVYGEAAVIPTPEDYGPLQPISLYGAGKLGAEGLLTAYAHTFDLQVWILRFANVIGPRGTHGVLVDFMRKLRVDRSKLEILGDGRQSKSYLTVEDCVAGMLFALDHGKDPVNIFNLGTDDAVNVRRIAELVVEELGLRDVHFHFTGGSRGWKGDVPRMLLDCGRLRALGWRPTSGSERAVRHAVGHLKAAEWAPFQG